MLSNSFAFLHRAELLESSSSSSFRSFPGFLPPNFRSLPLPTPSEDADFRNEVLGRQIQHGRGQGSSSSSSSWSTNGSTATPSSPFYSFGNDYLDYPTSFNKGPSTPQLYAPWQSSLPSVNGELAHPSDRHPSTFTSSSSSSSPTSSSPYSFPSTSYDAFLQSQCCGLLQQPVSPTQYMRDCEEPPTQLEGQQQQLVQLPSTLFSTSLPQSYDPTTTPWNSSEEAGGYFQPSAFEDAVDVGGGSSSSYTNDLEVDFGDSIFNPPNPPSSPQQVARPLKIVPGVYHPEVHESDDDLSPMEGVSGFLGEETAFVSKLYHIATHPEYAHYLRWSQDGSAFCLLNSEDFATKVLPRFFRHSKFNSFLRQLRLYSFQRVSVVITLDANDAYTTASPKLRRHSLLASQNGDSSLELSDSASCSSSSLPDGCGNWPTRKVTACGFTHVNFNRDNPNLLKLLHPKTQILKKPRNRSMASKKAAAALREEEGRKTGARGRKSSS